jgi:hypothetical protein
MTVQDFLTQLSDAERGTLGDRVQAIVLVGALLRSYLLEPRASSHNLDDLHEYLKLASEELQGLRTMVP